MSTSTTPTTDPTAGPGAARSSAPTRTPLLAALALSAAVVLNAVGTFGAGDADHGWGSFLVVVATSAAATAVVFGLVVRTAPGGDPSRRAVALGAVAAVSFVVFWSGITVPLALGAVACALVARDREGRLGTAAGIAVGLATLAVVAVTVLAFIG
jgi:hypothetical protein